MEELPKAVTRQDANFKLSPSTSNETSINLSNVISNFISDESREVTFKIYKDDFIKAISTLCLIPKVFLKKNIYPSTSADILSDLYPQIIAQFGESSSSLYTVYILKRDDGRAYLNDLKKINGFNIRSFLVEQFSEIKFIKDENGPIEMRLKTSLPEDSVERKKIDTSISYDIDQPLQLIYYGAPGTGKSYTIDKDTNETNSVRTTFHPDSDYAGFVGAYKPTMENVPMSAFVGKEVHVAQPQGEHTGKERKIVYKYVPQAFLKAYVEAWKRYSPTEDNPYYLVIEEINRGNCAQIFGDLFQLLDRNNTGSSSYAISADEDIAQFLRDDVKGFAGFSEEQKNVVRSFVLKKDSGSEERIGNSILNGSKLLLPPNMRIWATMNTSDQSLFPIDSAFKRRWNWEYVPIQYDPIDNRTGEHLSWKLEVNGKTYSWGAFLDYINPKILEITQSEDKQMGYFFAKPDKKSKEDLQENDTISTKVFVNKVLFYLWTDVFKDYDLTQEPFIYEDKNKEGQTVKKAYRFTDFFSGRGDDMLTRFVNGMKLIGIEEQDDVIDETEDGKIISLNGFKVNGGKADTITWSLHQILKPVVGNMSYEQLSSKIKEFIPRETDVVKIIDSPENYTKENGWLKHYLTTSDGVSFVITNQWKKEFIPMVKALADNLGIEFEQI